MTKVQRPDESGCQRHPLSSNLSCVYQEPQKPNLRGASSALVGIHHQEACSGRSEHRPAPERPDP